jgi:hypothetical protein
VELRGGMQHMAARPETPAAGRIPVKIGLKEVDKTVAQGIASKEALPWAGLALSMQRWFGRTDTIWLAGAEYMAGVLIELTCRGGEDGQAGQ